MSEQKKRYILQSGKFHAKGKEPVKPGGVVELNEAQAEAFKDQITSVDALRAQADELEKTLKAAEDATGDKPKPAEPATPSEPAKPTTSATPAPNQGAAK